MKSKRKQTALITGASSGIGLGLTKGFLAEGFYFEHLVRANQWHPPSELSDELLARYATGNLLPLPGRTTSRS
jgi:NAD(P)-dependent dehydrogenase (short-subunit alcohol dehydrogenase family)